MAIAATNNPLEQYFRHPTVFLKLPSKGIWYKDGSVTVTEEGEVPIYPMSALDDILLNTPDAMLNGQALEKVVVNCVPAIHNIKKLLLPDLEAIFVGMKSATAPGGKIDYERKCPKCDFDNTYVLKCSDLLDMSSFINEDETTLRINEELILHIKPYDFSMRQMFIKREFEEEKVLRTLDQKEGETDELNKAHLLAESVDRLSKITFDLVSQSIEKIVIIKDNNKEITDRAHINQWLMNISKPQADLVIEAVNKLNAVGVPKETPVTCSNCTITWTDTLTFDPASFFGRRS